MVCTRPKQVRKNEDGSLYFIRPDSQGRFFSQGCDPEQFGLPCGSCLQCRLRYSRDWAIRNMHEAQICNLGGSYPLCSYVTLTFNSFYLPKDKSLDYDVVRLFIKRFKHLVGGDNIRYFYCGEYGENNWRPHYHICLYGFNFDVFHKENGGWVPDLTFLKKNHQGDSLYTSKILDRVWPFGFNVVGELTFQSAAYVARYITKKVNGDFSEDHYRKLDESFLETGEFYDLRPEFVRMSRKPGIGQAWFEKYWQDVYPSDEVVIERKGKMVSLSPPRYYDKLLEQMNPVMYQAVKLKRQEKAKSLKEKMPLERLAVIEKVKELDFRKLIRNLDMEI